MPTRILATLASTALIAFGSPAFAQTGGGAGDPGAPAVPEERTVPEAAPEAAPDAAPRATPEATPDAAPQASPGTDMPGAQDKGMAGTPGKMNRPTQDLVGKELVNATGEAIGDIEAITDDALVVGVGGFLGIGERKVRVPWEEVQVVGTANEMKIQTNKTKAELKAMPEYKEGQKM